MESGRSPSTASQARDPWGVLASKQVNLTPEWQRLRFTFTPKQDEEKCARIVFVAWGMKSARWRSRRFHSRPARCGAMSLRDEDRFVPAFTRDENSERTLAAQRDWYQFLWDLEERYWPGMYKFIREELRAQIADPRHAAFLESVSHPGEAGCDRLARLLAASAFPRALLGHG